MMLSSATVLLPLPGLTVVLAGGALWNPLLVGLAAGLGSGLGELTGFVAGSGTTAILEERYHILGGRLERLVRRYGFFAVLLFAVVPNPFFDAVGILAGALELPLWQFLLAATLGNCAKATLLALFGHSACGWFAGLWSG